MVVRQAMDAAGMSNADAARTTGLSDQHISQILNRQKRYTSGRLPTAETQQQLAKLPGLSLEDIQRALAKSAGIKWATVDAPQASGLRRNVHNLIDEFADDQLARVLQVLLALRD